MTKSWTVSIFLVQLIATIIADRNVLSVKFRKDY